MDAPGPTVRWGIVGPGGIAERFATSMAAVDGGEVVAVASRSMARADAFADRFAVPGRFDDLDALAASTSVDAIYIATPNHRHAADAIGFLEAGKHVLCEKPLALNALEVGQMVAAAERADRFLMEAIWSRFLPGQREIGRLVAEVRIGQPQQVEASFGFPLPFDAAHRLYDPAQGGGALLDLGIYPLQLCTQVLGPVDHVAAVGALASTSVDEQVAAVLRHDGGGIGVVRASIALALPCTARISGTEGWIDIPAMMHCPTSLVVQRFGEVPETIDCSFAGDGLEPEIEEVHRCLAEGQTASPSMPWSESRHLASVMDEIRAQIGVAYPGERALES